MPELQWVDLLQCRFAKRGRGPNEFDCYGLVMELHRRRGITIPDYSSPEDQHAIAMLMDKEAKVLWEPCGREPGAVALFKILGLGSHVGYVLDQQYFLHCWEGSAGVVREKHSAWEKRLIGYYKYKDAQ